MFHFRLIHSFFVLPAFGLPRRRTFCLFVFISVSSVVNFPSISSVSISVRIVLHRVDVVLRIVIRFVGLLRIVIRALCLCELLFGLLCSCELLFELSGISVHRHRCRYCSLELRRLLLLFSEACQILCVAIFFLCLLLSPSSSRCVPFPSLDL